MALKPWEFERIGSTRTFDKMLGGAIRRYHLMADLVGFLRVDVLLAGGATFTESSAGATPKAGTPTFERVMGREQVQFVDPPPPTAEQEAAADDQRREAAAKLALAQAQLYEAMMRRDHPDMIVGGAPPSETEPSQPE